MIKLIDFALMIDEILDYLVDHCKCDDKYCLFDRIIIARSYSTNAERDALGAQVERC